MTRTIALISVLLLAGCGASPDAGEADAPEAVALVKTAPAQSGTTAAEAIVYGTAEAGPGGARTLIAPAEAIVDRVLAPDGMGVRAGQIILTLKPSRTTATDVAKAGADATAAKAALARTVRLRGDGLASDAEVETARAAARAADAVLANVGMGGGGVALRAPVSGTVQGLAAKSGDQIAAGATIATLADGGHLRARLGVAPELAQRVRPGQRLVLENLAGEGSVTATVSGVDIQADPTTRLSSIYAAIPAGLSVGAGEALRGSLTLAQQASGITIPYGALLDDGGKSYVFVVKGGVAHQRAVLPGNSSGDRIQILKGVAIGEKVVTEGGVALEDGGKVREQ